MTQLSGTISRPNHYHHCHHSHSWRGKRAILPYRSHYCRSIGDNRNRTSFSFHNRKRRKTFAEEMSDETIDRSIKRVEISEERMKLKYSSGMRCGAIPSLRHRTGEFLIYFQWPFHAVAIADRFADINGAIYSFCLAFH
jgi:hypothetical protein